MLTALFGLAEIGAIAVPLNRDATPAELLQAYRACGARWAVVEDCLLDDHRAPARPRRAWPMRGLLGVSDFAALCSRQPDEPVTDVALTDLTVAELLYTSGTTAAPKGVMITHGNLVFSGHYGVWQTSLRGEDRLFTTMPACHSNFQLAALMPVLVAGATLVMAEKYSASHFWEQVRQEGATIVQLIAMMARTLLLQPPSPDDGRHQLRDALYFMPLSDTEKTEFERRFRVRAAELLRLDRIDRLGGDRPADGRAPLALGGTRRAGLRRRHLRRPGPGAAARTDR